MPEIATVRVRQDWLEKMLKTHRTMTSFAEKLGIEKSTVSRQASGKSEASPRFIGAVMTKFAIDFDDAFDVTIEEVAQRRARIVTRPTGKRVIEAQEPAA
ncbi:hypothetical protein F8M49_29900 [Rhodococcus zopfii]|uniref:HTH cro/C1-type domain-containing protein n=1 Tax=Rhodococcus zopfii TaxID=43772 RepID=A0ABU3WJQ1_9NOCA|nr:hypothetical protein [Rhodococcus zopfii]MDV2478576.1 hypothetical protein [Rhodococcus zopfii]